MIKKIALRLLRPGSRRYMLARRLAGKGAPISEASRIYNIALMKASSLEPKFTGPTSTKFSIVIPAFNTSDNWLYELIYSVINQSYPLWELIISDASDNKLRQEAIDNIAKNDPRIKVVRTKPRLGISANTNQGLESATGDFICFCDHDDVLKTNALAELAEFISENPKHDLIYSDEEKLSANGAFSLDPHFKPDWSPDLLRNVNYITHFVCVRADLLRRVGNLNPERDGAQDYDFLLRAADAGASVGHIQSSLYFWRLSEGSTASDFSSKKNVIEAGVKSLEDHLKRNDLLGEVWAIPKKPGFYRIRYSLAKSTSLHVLILLGPNFLPHERLSTLKHFKELLDESEIKHRISTNFDTKGDISTEDYEKESSKHRITMFVRSLVRFDSHHDLLDLITAAAQPGVFAAAPKVCNTDGAIIDMGLARTPEGLMPLFKGHHQQDSTIFGNTEWVRDVDSLTGRILAGPTENFLKTFSARSAHNGFGINPENLERAKDDQRLLTWSYVVVRELSPYKRMTVEGHLNGGLASLSIASIDTSDTIIHRQTIGGKYE